MAAEGGTPGKPPTGEITVIVNFYFGSARRRVLDSQNTLILDALTAFAAKILAKSTTYIWSAKWTEKTPRIAAVVQETNAL